MARFWSILVFGVSASIVLTAGCAWSQEPRPTSTSPFQKDVNAPQPRTTDAHPQLTAEQLKDVGRMAEPAVAELLGALFVPAIPRLDLAELAGSAAATKIAVLTLEEAYSLTLIRSRNPAAERAMGPIDLLDPKALDEKANRAGASDYDRFRREFLASGFRDPAPGFLAALQYLQAVDSTRHQVAFAENMRSLYEELIRGEASGVSQLQVDQVHDYLERARQEHVDALTDYRTAVDELKVALGLPPGTPVVLDQRILGPFTTAFTAIDGWQRDPNHTLGQLKALHDRLPRLEDLKIGGQSLLEVIQGNLPLEPFLLKYSEAARTDRPIKRDDHAASDDPNAQALRIRRLIRDLIRIHKNYELERSRLELGVRQIEQRFEQIVAPPAGRTQALAQSSNAALQTAGVIEAQTRIHQGRMRFVGLWLQYKERGLALDRELGTMPYDNWDAFHRSFLPKAGRAAGDGKPAGPSTQRPVATSPPHAQSVAPPPPPPAAPPTPPPKPDGSEGFSDRC